MFIALATELKPIFLQTSLLLYFVLDSRLVLALDDASPPLRYPVGSAQNCLDSSSNRYEFEALPGVGWDNLQNLNMGLVSARSYSKCKASGKFLIPDDVILDPVKTSKLETFGKIYDHWDKYTSSTSETINVDAELSFPQVFSVTASFSSEKELVKKHQIEDKSSTTRVQMRNLRYKVKLQPDHALHSDFKTRVLDIASHLQHKNTENANFIAQLVVRDFGTHYITHVDAGAALVKLDHLKKSFVSSFKEQRSTISMTASMSFFDIFTFSVTYTHTSDKTFYEEYMKQMTHSVANTHGGPALGAEDWAGKVEDHLVPIDRSGHPIHIAITPRNFPELSKDSVSQAAEVVYKSIKQYYEHNTIRGCTDYDSPNFSFQANFDDGSCQKKPFNYNFGGIYQTCSLSSLCGFLSQKNPFTSGYSCGRGFRAILIRKGYSPDYKAHYTTYWCAPSTQPKPMRGYSFGGVYSHFLQNPVTHGKSCPDNFFLLRFGATMHLCVSDQNYGNGSLPFGGFYSCSEGNALAKKGAKSCPVGYAPFLAGIEQDCEIKYCVKSSALNGKGLPKIKRPPYMKPPKVSNGGGLKLTNHDTGQVWYKSLDNDKPRWLPVTSGESTGANDKQRPSQSSMSAGTAAGITFGVTALAGLLIATMVIGWRRYESVKIEEKCDMVSLDSFDGYGAVDDNDNNQ